MDTLLKRLANTSKRWPIAIVAIWLVLLITAGASVGLVGGKLNDNFSLKGAESIHGMEVLKQQLPEAAGTTAQVVIEGENLDTPSAKNAIDKFVIDARKIPHVRFVTNPNEDDHAITPNKHFALATVQIDDMVNGQTVGKHVADLGKDLREQIPGATIHRADVLSRDFQVGISWVEGIGVVLALVILLATFNSAISASIPILTALFAVTVSGAAIAGLSWAFNINTSAPTLAVMLGLSVGIDYSLLLLSRIRENLAEDMEPASAIENAMITAGKSIIFAGLTVIVALVSMWVVKIPFLTVMGLVSALSVAVTMVAVLTLVPAVATLLGNRLHPHSRRKPHPHRTSLRWAQMINRHPAITTVVCLLAAALLAAPATAMRLALTDAGSGKLGTEGRTTYDLISREYGQGYNASIAVVGSVIASMDPVADAKALGDALAKYPQVERVAIATPDRKASIAFVNLIPKQGQSDPTTAQLVRYIRADRDKLSAQSHVQNLMVTGISAVAIDVSTQLSNAMLPFGTVVVVLCIILLAILFKSLWVPVIAAAGYIASLGVAFGSIGVVFGWGWGGSLLGIHPGTPVITFMPIMVMGILFGLAMDYQVFMVSRIHEAHLSGKTTPESITAAFTGSGRVVAAAALIMTGVFAAFIPESSAEVRPIAIALTTGIAFDAFVVRMTLIPAVMRLLGHRAWALPGSAARARKLSTTGRHGRRGIWVAALIPAVIAGGAWVAMVTLAGGKQPNPVVAIVNQDEPYQTEGGQLLPAGRLVVAQLTEPKLAAENLAKVGITANASPALDAAVEWRIVTPRNLDEGLRSGEYALGVRIPENFSKTVAQTLESKEYGAVVKVEAGEDATASQALTIQRAVDAATGRVSSNLAAAYLQASLLGTTQLKDGLGQAAGGAGQLADGLGSARDGAAALADGAEQLEGGTGQLADGIRQLSVGADQAAGGARALAEGAVGLDQGAGKLKGGTQQLAGALTQYGQGIQTLAGGLQAATQGAGQLQPGAQQLAGGIGQASTGAQKLAGGIGQLAPAASQLASGTQQLAGGSQKLAGGLAQASQGATKLNESLAPLADGVRKLSDGVDHWSQGAGQYATQSTQLAKGAAQLRSGLDQYLGGIEQIAAGCVQAPSPDATCQALVQASKSGAQLRSQADQLLGGVTAYPAGAQKLADSAKQLQVAAGQLSQGASALQGGTQQLAQALGQLEPGAQQLARSSEQLAASTQKLVVGVEPLNAGAGQLAQALGQMSPGAQQLAGGLAQLREGLSEGAGHVPELVDGSRQLGSAANQLAGGVFKLSETTSKLNVGAQKLAEGNAKLADGLGHVDENTGKLVYGTKQLADGTRQLADGQGRLADGARQLGDRLSQAQERVPGYSTPEADQVASAIVRPITSNAVSGREQDRDWYWPVLALSGVLLLAGVVSAALRSRRA